MTITRAAGSRKGVSWVGSSESSLHNVINSSYCTLYAPLKSNLFLSRGTGAATWSRATAAWGFNELGYLQQIATGGAVFLGARNVTNQLRNISAAPGSEDLTGAGWTKENGTTTPTATTFVCANASGVQHRLRTTNSLAQQAGRILRLSGRFTYVDHPYIQLRLVAQNLPWGYVNLNLQTGATFNYGDVLASGSSFVSGTTYDFWADFKAPTDLLSNAVYIVNFISSETATSGPTFTGDGVKSIGLTRMSIVDVTSYPRTYNPEYVSFGVEEGKNFLLYTDDFSQSAWSKTNVTVSNVTVLNPNNEPFGVQKVEATASASTSLTQSVTNSGRVAGNTYIIYAKQGSDISDGNKFVLRNVTSATDLVGISLTYSTGVFAYTTGSSGVTVTSAGNGWWRIEFTVTTGISLNDTLRIYIGYIGAAETGGEFCYVYRPYLGVGTTIPVVIPAVGGAWDPFGGGADGVKYFETDYSGNILPDNALLGFRREVAATNSLRYSRDLSIGASSAGANTWFSVGQGSELLTNGDFSGGLTSWTNSSTGTGSATVGGGGIVLLGTDALNRGAITQGVSGLVIGKEYSLQADISSYTSGALTISLSSSQGTPGTTYTSNSSSGTKTQMFTATATTMYVSFHTGSSGGSMTIDNISFKESGIQSSLTVTGLDNLPNTATTLTAVANDATILQPITLSSAARCSSAYVKRRTGTGTISFTQDGGSTWTDITSQINSSTWTRVQITSTLTNPVVGFKITTSGDEIDVDCVQLESGAIATSPILTASSTVTRNADSLTYPTVNNIDFTVGSVFLETMHQGSTISSEVSFSVGTTAYLYRWSGIPVTSYRSYDGTNICTKNSISDITTGVRKRATSWGTSLKICGDGASPASIAFDGSFGSGAVMGIGADGSGGSPLNGTVKNVSIFNYEFSDSELQGITS